MAIVSRFEQKPALVIREVSGPATVQDFIDTLNETLSDPRFAKSMHAIWDLRKADLQLHSAGDVGLLVTQLHLMSEKRGTGYRIALVAPEKKLKQIAGFFEAQGSTLPVSMRIVNTMTEARRWVSTAPNSSTIS